MKDVASMFTDYKLPNRIFQFPIINSTIKIVDDTPPEKCNQLPPRFGNECQHRCHCLNLTEFCNKETGHCTSGCLHGWIGDNCQTSICKQF